MGLQQRSECCNRLCGHSLGIRGMFQVSHSNGSMTLLISEVADIPRHPSTRMLSKAGFWRGTTPAGNSLSSTEIGLCSELHVLIFKSQIAYGDSKSLLQVPSSFQHCSFRSSEVDSRFSYFVSCFLRIFQSDKSESNRNCAELFI